MSPSVHLARQEWQHGSVKLGVVDLPRQLLRLCQRTHLADRRYSFLVERLRPLRHRDQTDARSYSWIDWLDGLHHAESRPGDGHHSHRVKPGPKETRIGRERVSVFWMSRISDGNPLRRSA